MNMLNNPEHCALGLAMAVRKSDGVEVPLLFVVNAEREQLHPFAELVSHPVSDKYEQAEVYITAGRGPGPQKVKDFLNKIGIVMEAHEGEAIPDFPEDCGHDACKDSKDSKRVPKEALIDLTRALLKLMEKDVQHDADNAPAPKVPGSKREDN